MQDKINTNVVQYEIDLFQWCWDTAYVSDTLTAQEQLQQLQADLFDPQGGSAAGSSTVAPATYGLDKGVAAQILRKCFTVHPDGSVIWSFPQPYHLRENTNS
ncbi:hypothetical protein [Vibrio campbellii]|uniref:hypothetical protein n=1 Tax=Vibrio campbellii TaxID=680 RepID=UPI00249BB1DF|nr:hypothetical protein [Vibrio campbellii]